MGMGKLTDDRLKALAAEYLTNGLQKVKALISVGYSTNYAEHSGLKLFDNVRFKAILAQLQAKIDIKTDYTVEFVRQEMVNLLNAAKTKDDLTNVKGALELLGKHKAMFTDNVNSNKDLQPESLTEEELKRLKELAKQATTPEIKLVKTA
jgi:hypothetical protein